MDENEKTILSDTLAAYGGILACEEWFLNFAVSYSKLMDTAQDVTLGLYVIDNYVKYEDNNVEERRYD